MWGFGVLIFDFFGFFSYQFNVVTVFRFCHRTFVSTYPSRSTPFLYHFVNFFLRPVCTQECPALCGILSPSISSEFLHTSRDSPCPWQKSPCFMCVRLHLFVPVWSFLLCSSVFPHTNTPICTHPHPSTPNCILDCPSVSPLSHPCNPSVPSPILVSCMSSCAHPRLPMSPSRVRPCPYTSLHPSTPNHTHLWPFLVCIFTHIQYPIQHPAFCPVW